MELLLRVIDPREKGRLVGISGKNGTFGDRRVGLKELVYEDLKLIQFLSWWLLRMRVVEDVHQWPVLDW